MPVASPSRSRISRLFKLAAPVALIAALAMTKGCTTAGPLTLNDDTIVPGERIGEIQIGMPLATLMALKGTPLSTTPIQGSAATTYVFDGLTVGAHDQVYWIIANDQRFHTQTGVRPGAEQIFARAALGQPKCVASHEAVTTYDYGNLYFDVNNSTGKVTQVGVQKKTQTCDGAK
ncbi:MAG TPA: hypothetical protein VGO52_05730 [Hyphomonadaceae bacterium]|jgi:hypothetical protein|nr:hypothetical protein [Hyphomonadaceae bacterium]